VQNLELVGGDLEPSCLLPLTTGLTRLSLEDIILQPESGPLGVSQLLQLLAQLTALRDLSLSSIEGDWPQQQLAQYSALTASSNLQELRMYDCDIPGAAWLHVLPAGRKLPQLRLFSRWEYGRAACGAADIARLISCCPAVEDLNFTPAADASLAPLQSLSALTRLVIHEVSPAVIRSDLTALSQLRSLLCFLPAAAPAGEATSSELQHLVPLTALTGLTEFGGEFDGCVWMLSSNVSNQRHCTVLAGIEVAARVQPCMSGVGLHVALCSTAYLLCCCQAGESLLTEMCVPPLHVCCAGACRVAS
jgi:hypothetical protein